MKNRLLILAAVAFGALALPFAAFAGNTVLFSSSKGDLTFPITPPSNAGATPGTLDNTTIGATTPAAGTFTSVTAASSVTGPIVAPSITGNDSSLGIAGQAATTATGAGGAVATVGGIGGATSGAGGAVSATGGAATAGNSAGGAASLVGGAGSGSAAGGAASLTGGAGGATGAGGALTLTSGAGGSSSGAAGAVAISAGSATSANGANVTITAGSGAGGTNAGGSVNLVPGAAVSTGIPGQIKVNGDANLMCSTFAPMGAPAAATDTVFYVATRPLYVVSASAVFAVAAGGASKLQVTKDTSTNAPGAGTDLLTNNTNTGFDLNGTPNTVEAGTLVSTVATKTLAAGDRLAVDFADAIQSSSGIAVTVCMAPL